ncbi:hypothetical protein FO519_009451 [Halicephalobus sp. NKZ332]|nr:hypothetical protein FO519_009451 [Halicephalobus sp. NKZ332]
MKTEIESVKVEIDELKAMRSAYIQKYEMASDNMKPEFLKLLNQMETQLAELQRQKTILLEHTPSPSDCHVVTPATAEAPSPIIIDLPIPPNEEEAIERMKNYVYLVDGVIACATAISSNTLASCYHCVKHYVTTGPDIDELYSHRNAVIRLTHAITNQKIQAKIRAYSVEKDVVLLQTDGNLMVGDEIEFRHAYIGQAYYLLGTPISDDGNPLQVISGRISAILERSLSSFGYSLHGHGSARPGASGGPVFARGFSAGKPTLLGIVVAGQTISHETKLLTFVSSNYVKIISFATLHDIYLLSEEGKFKL